MLPESIALDLQKRADNEGMSKADLAAHLPKMRGDGQVLRMTPLPSNRAAAK